PGSSRGTGTRRHRSRPGRGSSAAGPRARAHTAPASRARTRADLAPVRCRRCECVVTSSSVELDTGWLISPYDGANSRSFSSRGLMEFRILGPIDVVDGERSIALGPSKQRAVLAILVLHLNEVVSRDRLIEDLWGESAPATATTALHGYVSQLRKVLEPNHGPERGVLITRAPGYVLELDPDQVDVQRFELLARRGKQQLALREWEAAASTLTEALSLWRGPPLAEFG